MTDDLNVDDDSIDCMLMVIQMIIYYMMMIQFIICWWLYSWLWRLSTWFYVDDETVDYIADICTSAVASVDFVVIINCPIVITPYPKAPIVDGKGERKKNVS